jgi:hypothetical protein
LKTIDSVFDAIMNVTITLSESVQRVFDGAQLEIYLVMVQKVKDFLHSIQVCSLSTTKEQATKSQTDLKGHLITAAIRFLNEINHTHLNQARLIISTLAIENI